MLRTTILVRALSIACGATTLAGMVVLPALAQSNAAGTIFGRVDQPAGATVVLNNVETGLKRSAAPDASGAFRVTALPPGHYRVDLVRNGAVERSTEVDVLIGQGVDASFGGAVQSVQVTGRRSNRIDVSSADNGATFTARELAQLPITQSVDAIIQLAPNTTRADPRYAAGASFGGGGASENSYYINGFPVTNPLTQLGASELPFGAIGQAQILTGGFGAEFGRSVGGVVNITTKSGTNSWEFGVSASTEPNSLRSKQKNIFYAHNGFADTDGTLYQRNDQNSDSKYRYGAYVGGPIVKDTLFMFVSAERIHQKQGFSNGTQESVESNGDTGWLDQRNLTTRYLGKLDWNISNEHRLEWTTIGDQPEADLLFSGFDNLTGMHSAALNPSGGHYESSANITPTTGAKTNILRYTGNLSDTLTVSALYGKNKTDHVNNRLGYNPNMPGIIINANGQPPSLPNIINPQPFAGQRLDSAYSYDEVRSNRLDIEWKIGDHTVRGGFDNNKLSSFGAGQIIAGGYSWVYGFTASPGKPVTLNGYPTVVQGSPLADQGYYVYRSIFNDVTQAFSNQSAQYIEDRWQISKNLLLTVGLRDEQYKNLNGDGVAFLKIDKQLNPRASAVWDVHGDATFKVFGSAGRYSIQIPTHVAVRGASRSTLTREYFSYTGINPDGTPVGLKNLTPVTSSDNEFGQPKLAETVAAQNLKPSYQDELTIGFDKQFSPELNVGAKVTYRKLRQTIDDWCDGRPFETWAAAHNVDISNWGGFNCASINPGRTNEFLVDFAGSGSNANLTRVTLTAADMGFAEPTRVYKALDLYLEHPLRNGWYGKVNYTWSRSKGNTEGQTLSAVAQTDVAATQTWDHREIMEYADGLLPNDREHQLKAFGYWQFQPEWAVGGNLLVASGQPITCLGTYPTALQANDPGFPDYGSAYHYCYGQNGADNPPAPPDGSHRLPWDVRLDLNLVYHPAAIKDLAFKVDVFNVFNKQTVQQVDQLYNTDSGDRSPTFGTPGSVVGYTAPRSVKLGVEYNHKF
ncbi:TonB-dependent receptor [Massilia arenosa]|uniref:TonB-dependent receptor n=1 Tax=Zemynaea arenosa TaxID=2561931 RepID=A0A4Y9SH97_9BURK|nr:TonB-dependent receptor [Massilia arenosa]TFW20906.1 TonB-dependent receptor [Massilia arenosa]